MDIKYLTNDELQVEFDIRQIGGSTCDLEILTNRLAEERKFPSLIPDRPHESAVKNPDHELRMCNLKLNRVSSFLEHVNQDDDVNYASHKTRVLHVQGRLFRLEKLDIFADEIKLLLDKCSKILATIREKSVDSLVSSHSVYIPNVPANHNHAILINHTDSTSNRDLIESNQNIPGPSDRISSSNEYRSISDSTPIKSANESSDLNKILTGIVTLLSNTQNRPEQDIRAIDDLSLRTSTPKISGNNRSYAYDPDKLHKIVKSWNIKFNGSRQDIPVERFVYRLEHMAGRFKLKLDDIVEEVTSLLVWRCSRMVLVISRTKTK